MEARRIEMLLGEMTLAEKIGQLVQLTPDFFEKIGTGEITGPLSELNLSEEEIYAVGSVLGTHTGAQVKQIQENYLQKNRLGIPLMFMADVIHGYETIFPIPLALASSWDPKLIQEMASLSAEESVNAGIQVTFSPMADLVQDARWGRVLESNGEDPYLSSLLTAAYVRGYQGDGNLRANKNKLASCIKHFIGYGKAEAGRDYNTVDLSTISLYQNYLPAFQAALEAGAKLVMTSFNLIHGIPATGNHWLMREVLRGKLNFEGVLISDWAAVAELITHGVALNKKAAAEKAIKAGVDIDMMTNCYQKSLAELIKEETIPMSILDEAVLRVLKLKNDLGLFEDPLRGAMTDLIEDKTFINSAAQRIAAESMVLLKNNEILPLASDNSVALLGPKAFSKDVLGAWFCVGEQEKVVTLADSLAAHLPGLTTVKSEAIDYFSQEEIAEMQKTAKEAESVILALGESSEESGEAASKATIRLSRAQECLLQEIYEVNENIIVVLFNGRPIDLTQVEPYAKAILEVWFPGTRSGQAISDILMGIKSPTGRLPISFPRTSGQVPLYYNHLSTGRPLNEWNKDEKYISKYLDVANEPLYPFGFGLSYTSFEIKQIVASDSIIGPDKGIDFFVTVKNIGVRAGRELIQLYIHDEVAEVARPVKELKTFVTVNLEAGEEQTVKLTLSESQLRYIHPDLTDRSDAGTFIIFIGTDSKAPKTASIKLIK